MRFETHKISDLIDEISMGPFGSNIKVECFVAEGIPVLNGSNLEGYKLVEDTFRYVTEEKADSLGKANAHRGDIVITHRGTLGQIVYIPLNSKHDRYVISQSQFRVKCNSKVLPEYLVYYFHTREGQYKLLSNASQVGVPALARASTTFQKIEVPIPAVEEQKRVVAILDALQNKLELNNAINHNLQQQARALFKAWFVDFEPFGGEMPNEWHIGKLKDTLRLKRDGIKVGDEPNLPYLPIDVIPMKTFAVSEFKPNEDAQSSLITFDKDDIVIGAMRVYFHRVIFAPCRGITRTTCFTLKPYDADYLSFGLLCCDQDSSIDYAQTTSKGSTMPYAVWDGGLGDMEISIPPKDVAKKFNDTVLPMLRHIQASYFENQNLVEMRDSILPRLMSGEIDLSEVEI